MGWVTVPVGNGCVRVEDLGGGLGWRTGVEDWTRHAVLPEPKRKEDGKRRDEMRRDESKREEGK